MYCKILIVLLSITLSSCIGQERDFNQLEIGPKKNEEMQEQKNKDTVELSKNIDSLEVTCLFFGQSADKAFTLHFSGNRFICVFHHGDEKRFVIKSLEKRNQFANYINAFYIDKSAPIVLMEKLEPAPVTDYPWINIEGFRNGKKILAKKITLYSNMVFNPKFLEFYEFLEELIIQE